MSTEAAELRRWTVGKPRFASDHVAVSARHQPFRIARLAISCCCSNHFGPVSLTLLGGGLFCTNRRTMSNPKRTVYVLRSACDPPRYYTGVTSDVNARLAAHNAGRCPHTSDGKPWQVDVIVQFADERRAVAFEHYLKSGSGAAFAKRPCR